MKGWWYSIPKAFTPLECAELVAYAQTKPAQAATIGHGGKLAADQMRRSTVRWLDAADAHLLPLTARLNKMLLEANSKMFGVDYHGFHELQFTEYNANNEGHYDWHEDNCWKPAPERHEPWDRKLSLVVQLSAAEAYQGGRLELDRDPLPQDRFTQQGDVIVKVNGQDVYRVLNGVDKANYGRAHDIAVAAGIKQVETDRLAA